MCVCNAFFNGITKNIKKFEANKKSNAYCSLWGKELQTNEALKMM